MICPIAKPITGTRPDESEWRLQPHCCEQQCAWWCGGVCVTVKLAVELAKVAGRLPKQ